MTKSRARLIKELGEKELARHQRREQRAAHDLLLARTLVKGILDEIANPTDLGVTEPTWRRCHGVAATADGKIHRFNGNLPPMDLYSEYKSKGGMMCCYFESDKLEASQLANCFFSEGRLLRVWTSQSTAANKALTKAVNELINRDQLPDDLWVSFCYMDCRGAGKPWPELRGRGIRLKPDQFRG
jgi:hypothetical protein